MSDWKHVFVVARLDKYLASSANEPGEYITIKEVLPSEEEAVLEVERLNAGSNRSESVYFFQCAKYFAQGRES